MQPSRMLVLGFSIIILAGATLLFLPISSKSGQFSSFIDCLFTATSATCVTGITVLDTFNYFNGFGQGVILALIQVGGLGFLTLVTFINLILGKKLGWSTVKIAASDLTDNALETTPKRLFYEIVLYSFAIEFVGAVILAFVFVPDFGALGIFEAIFLSVSAFCNAGFDLLTATPGAVGLSEYTNNPLVMITLIVLITTGGLGFIVWRNIRHYSKAKRLLLHTKLVLIMAAVMLLVGAAIIFIVEFSNQDTLGQMPIGEKILRADFNAGGKAGEGMFSAAVTDFGSVSIAAGNPVGYTIPSADGGYYMAYNVMAITAAKDSFIDWEETLTSCMGTLEYSESYVNATKQAGQEQVRQSMEISKNNDAILSGIMSSWENRNKSADIASQKQSDATLGYERVYDTETGDIYKAENGFTDGYDGDRFEPITDDMYAEAISGYIE